MRIPKVRRVTRAEQESQSTVSRTSRYKPRRVAIVAAMLLGTLVPLGGVIVTSSPASATACSSGSTTTNCTSTGTLTLTGGTLSLTAPSALAWSATMNGSNLSLYDSTSADQGYVVSDATGTGAGWHVTLAATTFTNGSHTLSNTGTFSTNGSITSATATTAPSATCVSVGGCTVPTNTTTYPVAVTTAASPTPVTVYDTSANSGMGSVQIGGSASANPVGWWLNVPATAYSGSYTSTLTFSIVAGP